MSSRQRLGIPLGLLCALGIAGLGWYAGLSEAAVWTAGVTALCAVWWVSEALPIPATSLIPFAVFPLAGVLDHSEVATAYGHTLILLLLGGFILATAMERSGAHRRLALGMIALVGGQSGRRLVLGFMLAAAGLSMWISNTATVLMLLPVALAVLDRADDPRLAVPLLLGLAYAASIGGLGTPIGTPPNVIFMGTYKEFTGDEIGFLDWMIMAVPVVAVLVPVAWFWLTRYLSASAALAIERSGPWTVPERRVLLVFGLAAAAWMTRTAPFGGWSAWFGVVGAGDSTVALAAVVLCFLIPDGRGERLLDWETANRIPWGLLILFGGGIAIAKAFMASGLSDTLGEALSGLTSLPLFVVALSLCLAVTFMTEMTSNTASATLLMPILAAAALGAAFDPALLMVPAVLSASCAFMLPVATAPNAVVFGTGKVPIRVMAQEGFVLNLLGALVIAGFVTWWLPAVWR